VTTQTRGPTRRPQDRRSKNEPETIERNAITVDGKAYELQTFQELTLQDTIDLEDATGREIDDLKGVRAIAGLLWLAMRRDVPTLTYQDVTALPWGQLDQQQETIPTEAVSPVESAQTA